MSKESTGKLPVVDKQAIMVLADILGEDFGHILAEFFLQLEEQCAALESALASKDCHSLMESAHSLKGAAANFGATRLSTMAAAMEQAGRVGDISQAKAEFDGFDDCRRETLDAFAELGFKPPV